MDKSKSVLVKSKSSNSAITSKSEASRKNNKKSRSNAEFQPLVLKKRGVYVEKKPTKISINETEISPIVLQRTPSPIPPSPKPKPRPGRKRFLNSVLTILSQSTTGTQYPDKNDPDAIGKLRTKSNMKKKKEDEENILGDSTMLPTNSKKKQKYRSRILNNEYEQLVVLQSTKAISHTPSNFSVRSQIKEHETIKWADCLPPIIRRSNNENIRTQQERSKNIRVGNKEKRVRLVDTDPATLVAAVPKKEEKKLYNFFVDLIETTFNVYNVKTEINSPALPCPPACSANSSRITLEIDETVANKLNIQKFKESKGVLDDVCCAPKTPSKFYCIRPEPNELWDDEKVLEHFKASSRSKSPKRKRKLQSESFNNKKPNKSTVLTTASLTLPTKKQLIKKQRKKMLLKLLKEQLKMENDAFVEPQNFFQALQVIARNKRRCQKSIHFNDSTKKNSEGDVHICQFKRRRLLSASTNASGKKSNNHPTCDIRKSMHSHDSFKTASSKKRTTITISETSETEDPSQMSLEVYGFDYEPKSTNKKKNNTIVTTTPPSEEDYILNEAILKYSDSDDSSILGDTSHGAIRNGLRTLSQLLEN